MNYEHADAWKYPQPKKLVAWAHSWYRPGRGMQRGIRISGSGGPAELAEFIAESNYFKPVAGGS